MHLDLRNTRPKRNRHVIADVKFVPGSNQGALTCRCGMRMLASQFVDHRKAAGAAESRLRVPERLRDEPSPWKRVA